MNFTRSAEMRSNDGLPVSRPDALKPWHAARAAADDLAYRLPERRSDLQRIEQLVSTLFVDRAILEIGCGAGFWTRVLAQKARHVLATDLGAETLALAASRGLDPAKVSLREADPLELPDAIGVFEGVFAAHWWARVPVQDRHACLTRLTARLAPRSRVVMLDEHRSGGSGQRPVEVDGHGNAWHLRCFDDGVERRVLANLSCAMELRIDLKQHGQVLGILEMQHYRIVAWLTPG